MTYETLQSISAPLSVVAAAISGLFAFWSYRLERRIQHDLKMDERIIAGTPIHPLLRSHEHSACVIQCTLVNKSKRKAFVNDVSVYNQRNAKIDVTWSDAIDPLGNPQNPCELISLVDTCSLFIRTNDGAGIEYARISISHSFSDTPMDVIFDPMADWDRI